jgi:hypothetical protein
MDSNSIFELRRFNAFLEFEATLNSGDRTREGEDETIAGPFIDLTSLGNNFGF